MSLLMVTEAEIVEKRTQKIFERKMFTLFTLRPTADLPPSFIETQTRPKNTFFRQITLRKTPIPTHKPLFLTLSQKEHSRKVEKRTFTFLFFRSSRSRKTARLAWFKVELDSDLT